MRGESEIGALNGRIKDRVYPPRRPRQQVETSTISCDSDDDETRMYAKLILSKVRKLEVEVAAALSVKCSDSGSCSGEVEVVELDGEEGGSQMRGDHDDLSGLTKGMEKNCGRFQGEVVTIRKLAEVLVDHVMEPGSESETPTASNPVEARSGTDGGSADETRMFVKLILSKVRKLEVEVAALSLKCSSEHRSTSVKVVEVVDLEAEEEKNAEKSIHKPGPEHGLRQVKKEMDENYGRIHGEVVTLRKLAEVLVDHVMMMMEPESESKPATRDAEVVQLSVADEDRACTGASKEGMTRSNAGTTAKQELLTMTPEKTPAVPMTSRPSIQSLALDQSLQFHNSNNSTTQIVGRDDLIGLETGLLPSPPFSFPEGIKNESNVGSPLGTSGQEPSPPPLSVKEEPLSPQPLEVEGEHDGAEGEEENTGERASMVSLIKGEPLSPQQNIPVSPVSSEATMVLSNSPASSQSQFKRSHSSNEGSSAQQTSPAASVPRTPTTSTSGQSLSVPVPGISLNSVNVINPMTPSELAEWRKQEVEKSLEAIKRAKLDKSAKAKKQELTDKEVEDSVQASQKTKPRDTRDITVDTKDEKSNERRSSSSHHHHHRDKDRRSHRDKDKRKENDKKLKSRDRDRDHKSSRDKDKDKHGYSDRSRDKDKKSEKERQRCSSSSGHKSSHNHDEDKLGSRSKSERGREKDKEGRSDRHKEEDKDKGKHDNEKESGFGKDRSSKHAKAKDSEKEKDRHGDKDRETLSGASHSPKSISTEKEEKEVKQKTTEKTETTTEVKVEPKDEAIVEWETVVTSSSDSTSSPTVALTAATLVSAGEVETKHEVDDDASIESEPDFPPSRINTPDFAEISSATSTSEGQQEPLFQATLQMPALGEFKASFFNLSHNENYSNGPYFPDSPVPVIGRIDHDTVWGYIEALKKSKPKEIFTFRMSPAAVADSKSYMTYFKYLSSRGRLGVIGGMCPPLRDVFLLPLEKDQPMPEILEPFSGPGLPKDRTHCLLAIVIRHVDVASGELKRKISAVRAETSASEKKTKIGTDRVKDGSIKMGDQRQMETASDKGNDNESYTPLEEEQASQDMDKPPETHRKKEVTSFLGSSTLSMSKPSESQELSSLDPRSTRKYILGSQLQLTSSPPHRRPTQTLSHTSIVEPDGSLIMLDTGTGLQPSSATGAASACSASSISLVGTTSRSGSVKKAQVGSGRPKHGLSSSRFADARDVEEDQEMTEAPQLTVTVEDRTYTGAAKERITNRNNYGGTVEQAVNAPPRGSPSFPKMTTESSIQSLILDHSLPAKGSTTQIIGRDGELEARPQSISAIDSASSSSPVDPPVGGPVSDTENGVGETQDEVVNGTQAKTSHQWLAQTSAPSGQRTHRRKKEVGLNLVCSFCQKKFACKKYLKNHILSHTGERPYSCNLCPYKCSRKRYLRDHLDIHRSDRPKGFECKVCQKCFLKQAHLTRHIEYVHEKKRPFKCGQCLKTFARKGHLNRHQLIHTGEKKHCCGTCNKTFARKDHLLSHIRHNHTGEESVLIKVDATSTAAEPSVIIRGVLTT